MRINCCIRLSGNRFVTLTGPGGVGKTRLALRVAEQQLDSFNEGVWFVELAALQDGALVLQTVARVLGLRDLPTEPLMTTLRNALNDRQLLLLLDNCEHVLTACQDLVHQVFDGCHQIHILATRREVLNIGAEAMYRVPALRLPEADALGGPGQVAESEAAMSRRLQ